MSKFEELRERVLDLLAEVHTQGKQDMLDQLLEKATRPGGNAVPVVKASVKTVDKSHNGRGLLTRVGPRMLAVFRGLAAAGGEAPVRQLLTSCQGDTTLYAMQSSLDAAVSQKWVVVRAGICCFTDKGRTLCRKRGIQVVVSDPRDAATGGELPSREAAP